MQGDTWCEPAVVWRDRRSQQRRRAGRATRVVARVRRSRCVLSLLAAALMSTAMTAGAPRSEHEPPAAEGIGAL